MDQSPYPRSTDARWALTVLVTAYIFSFVDRTILTLMVDPIRQTLSLSDVQFSLLHGLAFAVFYTFLGIPIARLADRQNRVRIITAGIIIWSAMTAICGLARNFMQLFLARVGVGIGEAALSPAAYSVIADYFPPQRLAQALSIYTGAAYVGGGLALIAGGSLIALMPPIHVSLLGTIQPWQAVFFVVGLPGLLVAALMLTVKEPPRLGGAPTQNIEPVSVVVAHIQARRGAYGFLILAVIAHSMMWNGVVAWMPSVFIRGYGLSPATAGLAAGLALGISGTLGIVLGGALSAALRKRGRADANHIILLIASVAAVPIGAAMSLVETPAESIALYVLFLFFTSAPYGGIVAALQEITPNRMRAQVTALYQFALNLAGIGFGPTLVALIGQNVFGGNRGIAPAIQLVVIIAAPIAALSCMLARRPHTSALASSETDR